MSSTNVVTPIDRLAKQTGSGKTYTMGTAASVKEVSGKGESSGVIPQSIKSIFVAMQQTRSDYDITMKVRL